MAKEVRKPIGPFEDDEWGPYFLVPLSQELHAKVSPEDVQSIARFNWCASRESRNTKTYAVRWVQIDGKRYKIRMHRTVMGLLPGEFYADTVVVDHLGHDGLDNRRARLEIITQEENMKRSDNWKKKKPIEEPCL